MFLGHFYDAMLSRAISTCLNEVTVCHFRVKSAKIARNIWVANWSMMSPSIFDCPRFRDVSTLLNFREERCLFQTPTIESVFSLQVFTKKNLTLCMELAIQVEFLAHCPVSRHQEIDQLCFQMRRDSMRHWWRYLSLGLQACDMRVSVRARYNGIRI